MSAADGSVSKQRNMSGVSGAYASLSQSLSQQDLRGTGVGGSRNAGQTHPQQQQQHQQQHGKRGVLNKSNSAQSVSTRGPPGRVPGAAPRVLHASEWQLLHDTVTEYE